MNLRSYKHSKETFTTPFLFFTEKPVFTIGATPVINDLDNFSEVSLDRDGNSEVGTGPLTDLDSFANLQNLQDAPTLNLDENSNNNSQGVDPISAAFNSAASVFSTFSSIIIKGTASQPKFEENYEPPVHAEEITFTNPYGFIPNQEIVNAVPPAFFSPTEDIFKKVEIEQQPSNTFRLSNKRKTYAGIPGLSSSQHQSIPQNFNLNPMSPQSIVHADSSCNFEKPVNNVRNSVLDTSVQQSQEEPIIAEKESSGGGVSFSFSSLLEKIPVTKSLFGSSNDDHQATPSPQNNICEDFSVTSQNYFVSNQNRVSNFFVLPQENQQVHPPLNPSMQSINFFNPLQFNTTPFANKIQQPQLITPEVQQNNAERQQFNDLTTSTSAQLNNESQVPIQLKQRQPTELSTQQTPNIEFAPHSYSTPSPQMTENSMPISFFNPAEASEMFKSRQSDDVKPKNPYSNSRLSRGVGLYKQRASLQSESTSSNQALLPPTSLWTDSTQSSDNHFFTPTLPVNEFTSASQSISHLPQNNNSQVMEHTSVVSDENSMQQQIESISKQKSDLIIAGNENDIELFQVQPAQTLTPIVSVVTPPPPPLQPSDNVSSFFHIEASGSLSFFQAQQESFSQIPTLESSSHNGVNFFSMDKVAKEVQQIEPILEDLNSTPIISSTMQASNNDKSSMLNDICDKIDSLSACSRSTLSLFATSELDSTFQQKSGNVESLIPKYLQAHEQTERERRMSSVSLSDKNYRPVYCHWFYQNLHWHPFSMTDSMAIENAIACEEETIHTNGGRFEVNIKERRRSSIYWTSGSNVIRKCSWFFRDVTLSENRNLIPYDEKIANFLESEYKKALTENLWSNPINLPDQKDFIIMKDATTIEHHQMGNVLIVKRGLDEFDILDGEEGKADHLILCVSNFGDKIDENGE
jgi:WWE domain